MTKKRFIERYAGRTIKRLIGIEDTETNRVCVTIEENIRLLNELNDENKQLKQSHKEAWDLIKYIYDEIKEDGSMDYGRIRDLVVFE